MGGEASATESDVEGGCRGVQAEERRTEPSERVRQLVGVDLVSSLVRLIV